MEEFETLSEQLARVTNECERLREENARLCNLLSGHARAQRQARRSNRFHRQVPFQ